MQFSPSSVNPGLHVQLKDPWVLLQNASELQLWCVSTRHSSISEIGFKLHVNTECSIDEKLKSTYSGGKIFFLAKAKVIKTLLLSLRRLICLL